MGRCAVHRDKCSLPDRPAHQLGALEPFVPSQAESPERAGVAVRQGRVFLLTGSSLLSVSMPPRGPLEVTSSAVCAEAPDLARATRRIVRVRAHMPGTPWSCDRIRCNARPGSPHRSRAHGHRSGLPCNRRTWRARSGASFGSLSSSEPSDNAKYEFRDQEEDHQSDADRHDWRVAPRADVERCARIPPPAVSAARHRGLLRLRPSRV